MLMVTREPGSGSGPHARGEGPPTIRPLGAGGRPTTIRGSPQPQGGCVPELTFCRVSGQPRASGRARSPECQPLRESARGQRSHFPWRTVTYAIPDPRRACAAAAGAGRIARRSAALLGPAERTSFVGARSRPGTPRPPRPGRSSATTCPRAAGRRGRPPRERAGRNERHETGGRAMAGAGAGVGRVGALGHGCSPSVRAFGRGPSFARMSGAPKPIVPPSSAARPCVECTHARSRAEPRGAP